jgi:hypothetical protein
MEQIQERRRLNDEIERTFILASLIAIDIRTFDKTDRNFNILNLYETFYKAFALLVTLTSIYPQMRASGSSIENAMKWIDTKPSVKDHTETMLLSHCIRGVTAFQEYASTLADQGVIAPPVRG